MMQHDLGKWSSKYLYSTDSALIGQEGHTTLAETCGKTRILRRDSEEKAAGRFSAGAELYYSNLTNLLEVPTLHPVSSPPPPRTTSIANLPKRRRGSDISLYQRPPTLRPQRHDTGTTNGPSAGNIRRQSPAPLQRSVAARLPHVQLPVGRLARM